MDLVMLLCPWMGNEIFRWIDFTKKFQNFANIQDIYLSEKTASTGSNITSINYFALSLYSNGVRQDAKVEDLIKIVEDLTRIHWNKYVRIIKKICVKPHRIIEI